MDKSGKSRRMRTRRQMDDDYSNTAPGRPRPAGRRVTVAVRVRPGQENETCSNLVANSLERRVEFRDASKSFMFDSVLGPGASQAVTYRAVAAPLVEDVLNGVSGCLIAYGQTGAGKTFSLMELTAGRLGVIPRALHDVFDRIEKDGPAHTYEVQLSYLQVYVNQVYDLLSESVSPLNIREQSKDSHTVAGLTQHTVQSVADVVSLLELGSRSKVVTQTKLNNRSSRSHCILTFHIERQERVQRHHSHHLDGDVKRILRSKLVFVDLAGSERTGKTQPRGTQLDEAKYINSSLNALGNVVAALATKSSFVPWRDSKLTRLLHDALAGHTRTILLINTRPDDESNQETVASLGFGQRAMSVLTAPTVDEEVDYKALAIDLQGQLDCLIELRAQEGSTTAKEREELAGQCEGLQTEVLSLRERNEDLQSDLDQYQELCMEAAKHSAEVAADNTQYATRQAELMDAVASLAHEREMLLTALKESDKPDCGRTPLKGTPQRADESHLESSVHHWSPSARLHESMQQSPCFVSPHQAATPTRHDASSIQMSPLSRQSHGPSPAGLRASKLQESPAGLRASKLQESQSGLQDSQFSWLVSTQGEEQTPELSPRDLPSLGKQAQDMASGKKISELEQVLFTQIAEADSQRKRRELAEHQVSLLEERLAVAEGNSKVLEDTVEVMSVEVDRKSSALNAVKQDLLSWQAGGQKSAVVVECLARAVRLLEQHGVVELQEECDPSSSGQEQREQTLRRGVQVLLQLAKALGLRDGVIRSVLEEISRGESKHEDMWQSLESGAPSEAAQRWESSGKLELLQQLEAAGSRSQLEWLQIQTGLQEVLEAELPAHEVHSRHEELQPSALSPPLSVSPSTSPEGRARDRSSSVSGSGSQPRSRTSSVAWSERRASSGSCARQGDCPMQQYRQRMRVLLTSSSRGQHASSEQPLSPPRSPHKPLSPPNDLESSPRVRRASTESMLLSAEAVFNSAGGPPEDLLEEVAVSSSEDDTAPSTPESRSQRTQHRIATLFSAFDLNGDGVITRDEYKDGCHRGLLQPSKPQTVREPSKEGSDALVLSSSSPLRELSESVVEGLVDVYANQLCNSTRSEPGTPEEMGRVSPELLDRKQEVTPKRLLSQRKVAVLGRELQAERASHQHEIEQLQAQLAAKENLPGLEQVLLQKVSVMEANQQVLLKAKQQFQSKSSEVFAQLDAALSLPTSHSRQLADVTNVHLSGAPVSLLGSISGT